MTPLNANFLMHYFFGRVSPLPEIEVKSAAGSEEKWEMIVNWMRLCFQNLGIPAGLDRGFMAGEGMGAIFAGKRGTLSSYTRMYPSVKATPKSTPEIHKFNGFDPLVFF